MAEAIGGSAGGPFTGVGPALTGADATAIAKGTLTADSGNGLHISATANGGAGYPFIDPLRPDIGGAALARASGTESFSGGGASTSDVSASASSGGGFISFKVRGRLPPVNGGTSTVEARAAADRPVFPPSLGIGLQAGSFITGLPSESDVQALEEGHKCPERLLKQWDDSFGRRRLCPHLESYNTKSNTTGFFGAAATFTSTRLYFKTRHSKSACSTAWRPKEQALKG